MSSGRYGVSYRSFQAARLLAAALLAPWSFLPAAGEGRGVVGHVGEREITTQDVREALDGLTPPERARVSQDTTLLSQVIRTYFMQKAVLQEARERKWEESPEVKAQLERAREAALTESYLQALSKPPESFPSEEELQAGYEAAKPSLLVPRSYLLAQIFIAAPQDEAAGPKSKSSARLEAVRKALKAAGADFAVIARARSDEPDSASRGGEIGWLTETQIQPEIRAKLPKLALKVVSEPLRLNDGWHILKVLDAREPYTPTLEQVRAQLKEQMRADRTRANAQAYLSKLMEAQPVVIDAALSKVLPGVAGQ